MKRFILLILSLLCFISPVFAGNLLQQEYETKEAAKVAQDMSLHNTSSKGLIEDDYLAYMNGGGSFYGVLKFQQEKFKKNASASDSLDLRYLNLIINKYELIIKNRNYCFNYSQP